MTVETMHHSTQSPLNNVLALREILKRETFSRLNVFMALIFPLLSM
jgi:hypothetical protein